MAVELTPLHPTIGAEVRGVDLSRPVKPEVFAEIEAAFHRYGVLIFPQQPLTDEQQLAFSRLFGPLEVNPNYAGAKMRLRPDIADISNLDAEGRVLTRDDRRNLFNLLIEDLIAFATQPQFVYRHRWTVGDLVMWDNRCTMHRGRPYDDTQRRVLHRTTVSDCANTLEQEGLSASLEPSFDWRLRRLALEA